jgi:hypothetical protein
MFDGVSLGASSFSRRETLLVVGVSHISANSGQPHARLLGAPSMGLSHKGDAVAKKVQDGLPQQI